MTNDRIDKDLILELTKILKENQLTEIEWGRGDLHIKVSKTIQSPTNIHDDGVLKAQDQEINLNNSSNDANVLINKKGAIKSPMVGTVYLAPEPGAEKFVNIGDTVTEGQTLLIVEAMKTMNPIISTINGKVTEIFVKDASPVEYGEYLILIE